MIGLALCICAPARAADQPISAVKLILLQSAGGSEKLVFISRDPAFLFPSVSGPDDPVAGGARIELLPGSGAKLGFDLPPGAGTPGWHATDGDLDRYRFVNRDAPDAFSSVKSAMLKQGRLVRVSGKAAGLPLGGGIGRVAVRVITGSLRSCALLDASSIVVDVPGRLVATAAVAPAVADCTAQSLGVAECGDGVRQPGEACDGDDDDACPGLCQADCACGPFCGDGVVNQPSERCDGNGMGPLCPDGYGLGCTAGCSCCSEAAFCNLFPCCSSADVCISTPSSGSNGFCWTVTCTPPDTCDPPAQCGPGNYCCMPLGAVCFGSCCPGLTCVGADPGVCCGDAGYACTSGTECCSGTCTGGGTCAP
jgi:hypothetical protein